jgi:orotate phosphoribosyltransferase
MNAIADLLIRHKAIEFGDFTLASGSKSRYYVDVKTAVTHPDFLAVIAREIATRYEFDVVAGVVVGGVPLAVATALAAQKPFAIIRAEEKDHGKKALIIGDVRGKNILLVEDVTTSGGSAMYGISMLRNAGARADRVVTVVDREQGAAATLKKQAIDLYPLVRVSEIL